MTASHHDRVPLWSWLVPAVALLLAALELIGILSSHSAVVLLPAAALLIASVFAAVHHAEMLAARVGEPFGSIILAVAVTIIEVALIVSIMLSGAAGGEEVARDTVFSAVMIVLNGVIGLALVMGGNRHHEQTFRLNAASSALAVLGTIATLVLVLPDFTIAGRAGQYSNVQLSVIAIVVLALYAVFVFVQTIKHRDYFLESVEEEEDEHSLVPSTTTSIAAAVLLPISLLAVILLAKVLSHPLEDAVRVAGLPRAFVGVVIAAIVLLPEGIASVRAALMNRIQNSINLVLGSALASIGLTIPVVAVVAILSGMQLSLGVKPEDVVLLILTLFASTLTLGTGRTTVLQGAVHLGIFAVFILISAIP